MIVRTPPFTVAQIKEFHNKVKTGADFPGYIKALKQLGVTRYVTYVADGQIDYFGEQDYQVIAPARYERLLIAGESNIAAFRDDLKAHQQGQTDFLTFCNDCARSGIQKWSVCMDKMTCTYYDIAENAVLVETIPG